MPIIHSCKTCQFFDKSVRDDTGKCRRFPAVYVEKHGWVYPQVYGDDWCGEYVMYTNPVQLRDRTAPFASLVDRVSKAS